jgi:hypothetical protein
MPRLVATARAGSNLSSVTPSTSHSFSILSSPTSSSASLWPSTLQQVHILRIIGDGHLQGDQIGRIFAYWLLFSMGSFLENLSEKAA